LEEKKKRRGKEGETLFWGCECIATASTSQARFACFMIWLTQTVPEEQDFSANVIGLQIQIKNSSSVGFGL